MKNRRRNRILMLVENAYPADSRVRGEAMTLVQAGYRVTVIALRKTGQATREVIDGVQVFRIPRLRLVKTHAQLAASRCGRLLARLLSLSGYFGEYFYFTLACWARSLSLLFQEGFDVVHTHNPPDTLFIVGTFYRLLGKKFVFDHHDVSPELYLSRFGTRGGFLYRTLMIVERLSFFCAHMVISTNKSYRRIAITRGGKKPEQVFVVRNGPDLQRVKLRAPDEKLRRKAPHILGYVGALNPQDGVDYLLRALQQLIHQLGRKDFFCMIIGSGDALTDLKEMAQQLGIGRHVWFTGFIPDEEMLRYLSTADICVDPDPASPLNNVSTWIKIMEYMALGKPIVSFDLPETRVSAGHAALFVPPNDTLAFARAIERMMDDPQLRERMGAEGLRRVHEELSWEKVSPNLLHAYQYLQPGSRQARAAAHHPATANPLKKDV